jgi:succinate dehydrogenase / fumarate reductase, cytochrome b subunit
MAPRSRPLSPHLQIYRFTLTMTMSIVHRITGAANYAGTLLLVFWLLAAAIGGSTFDAVNWLFGSPLGQIVLFGYSWSLIHHALGGLRHFVWDGALAMDAAGRETLVRVQLASSVLLTLLAWTLLVWLK